MRKLTGRNFSLLLAPALLTLAGCGGGLMGANSANSVFSVTPGTGSIDTDCTGCNAANAQGASIHQFAATLANGSPAEVTWSVSGGDVVSGPGSISASGQYTPPSYLTADRAEVVVTATLTADPSLRASSVVTVTPGFLQPLTPENVALGANGTAAITGILAEAGGSARIRFALAGSPAGSGEGQGSLGATSCQRNSQAFTSCTVTYTAPSWVQATGATYVVATAGGAAPASGAGIVSRASAVVLVNAAGVTSNPATHQAQSQASVMLGTSGGNNTDYDTRGNHIVDCCSGTLGALVEDASKRQYLLSNNHVLAKSDHASVGDTIVQPGLIDNNCTPLGYSAGSGQASSVAPVAQLTGWLPLSSKLTNADAAIAQVASRAADSSGSILELGAKQPDGVLAAAPPGISSTGGRGEAAALDLKVAKSGRTTGLTCGGVSAVDLDVKVDYFLDCAETRPYLTKTFTHQLAISGNQFSDAGDSGALVVDAANAEPVGLYFAGGTDVLGVSQAVANPASDLLSELSEQVGGGAYTFVGTADHAVSCLSYGDSTIAQAQARTLSEAETARAEQPGGRDFGRGHWQEQRPPRRGRGDFLHRREYDGQRAIHGGGRAHPGDSLDGPRSGLRLRAADSSWNRRRFAVILRAGAGRGRQKSGRRQPDAAESGFFRRGRGPEPGQSERGRAGHLRGPQPPSRRTARNGGRCAHPLRGDGQAARHPLLCDAVAVEIALHGPQGQPAHAPQSPRPILTAESEAG